MANLPPSTPAYTCIPAAASVSAAAASAAAAAATAAAATAAADQGASNVVLTTGMLVLHSLLGHKAVR